MTPLVVSALGLLLAYALYIATLAARSGSPARDFADAGAGIGAGVGGGLPGWAVMFAGAGLMVSGMGQGLPDYLTLTARFGLQHSHTGLGLILGAMAGVLIQKRLWLAARLAGLGSPGQALGDYYGSVTLRLAVLLVALLFALPFAATLLSGLGQLVEAVTAGAIPRTATVWVLAFFLFLAASIGGWRGTVLAAATLAGLLAVLALFLSGLAEAVLTTPGFLGAGMPVGGGILPDRIPGVIQYSAGIGKETVQGGIFTAVGIASAALGGVGVALSPAMLCLAMTVRAGRAFHLGPVWLTAGLGGAMLVFVAPFLAARTGGGGVAGLVGTLAQADMLAGTGAVVLLAAATLLAVSVFATSGALIAGREIVLAYVAPGLAPSDQRLALRVTLAVVWGLMAAMAGFAPLSSAVVGALAVPLSVQLLPAFLGLAFVPWISRSAVLTGLVIGALLVFFTEPPGLILFEGLFLDLPWGRWPLTIHSAAWGLAFNAGFVLLSAIFNRLGPGRARRDRLHAEFAARWRTDWGGRAGRAAKWSLTLIWAFLAIGPGAILGNTFFSQPIFTGAEAALGLPSLWVWALLSWLIGVILVWWIAVPTGLGRTATEGLRRLDLSPPGDPLAEAMPGWIASGLARVTNR